MLSYRTYMNTVAIMPSILMCWLQNQNIKREVVKKVVPIASKKSEPDTIEPTKQQQQPANEPINEVSIEKNQEIV